MQRTSVNNNLLNWCCYFAYGDTAMRVKCIRHSKNAIFTHNFPTSATPALSEMYLSVGKLTPLPTHTHPSTWFLFKHNYMHDIFMPTDRHRDAHNQKNSCTCIIRKITIINRICRSELECLPSKLLTCTEHTEHSSLWIYILHVLSHMYINQV